MKKKKRPSTSTLATAPELLPSVYLVIHNRLLHRVSTALLVGLFVSLYLLLPPTLPHHLSPYFLLLFTLIFYFFPNSRLYPLSALFLFVSHRHCLCHWMALVPCQVRLLSRLHVLVSVPCCALSLCLSTNRSLDLIVTAAFADADAVFLLGLSQLASPIAWACLLAFSFM